MIVRTKRGNPLMSVRSPRTAYWSRGRWGGHVTKRGIVGNPSIRSA